MIPHPGVTIPQLKMRGIMAPSGASNLNLTGLAGRPNLTEAMPIMPNTPIDHLHLRAQVIEVVRPLRSIVNQVCDPAHVWYWVIFWIMNEKDVWCGHTSFFLFLAFAENEMISMTFFLFTISKR